jgi:hypothetical protein
LQKSRHANALNALSILLSLGTYLHDLGVIDCTIFGGTEQYEELRRHAADASQSGTRDRGP